MGTSRSSYVPIPYNM